MHKGHGNCRNHRRRRRRLNKDPVRKEEYVTIDDNITHQPHAYCLYHQGWLTGNLTDRHKCMERKCNKYVSFEEANINKKVKKQLKKLEINNANTH